MHWIAIYPGGSRCGSLVTTTESTTEEGNFISQKFHTIYISKCRSAEAKVISAVAQFSFSVQQQAIWCKSFFPQYIADPFTVLLNDKFAGRGGKFAGELRGEIACYFCPSWNLKNFQVETETPAGTLSRESSTRNLSREVSTDQACSLKIYILWSFHFKYRNLCTELLSGNQEKQEKRKEKEMEGEKGQGSWIRRWQLNLCF